MKKILLYLRNVGLSLDQLINTLALGDPDESICGRTARAVKSGNPKWFVPLIASVVNVIYGGKYHLEFDSIEPEERPWEKELWSWVKINH